MLSASPTSQHDVCSFLSFVLYWRRVPAAEAPSVSSVSRWEVEWLVRGLTIKSATELALCLMAGLTLRLWVTLYWLWSIVPTFDHRKCPQGSVLGWSCEPQFYLSIILVSQKAYLRCLLVALWIKLWQSAWGMVKFPYSLGRKSDAVINTFSHLSSVYWLPALF